jgi:phosphoribosylcarboxyaminoimidazole (NCAIR) mutase
MVLFGKHRAVLLSVSKAYYNMPSKATIVTLNANQAKLKWPNIVQTKDNDLKQQLKKKKKKKKRKSKMHHNR